MMKFTIDFSKQNTWLIILGLCGLGYLGVYTIQEMNAKDNQNRSKIQQLEANKVQNENTISQLKKNNDQNRNTIQQLEANNVQNQNTIQQLIKKNDEKEQKIRGLSNENQEKHRQIIQLQNEKKNYEQEKFIFEQGKEVRIMLASSIKDDVRVIKSQLNEFKEVVTLLENHVNQIENQNYQNT